MDYWKFNVWTEKDHFPMPFINQMLDRLAEIGWYYSLTVIRGTIKCLLHHKIKIKAP